ncbi:MAG TPA: aminotransferase class I/II-fold pyridoxal phosphate-dependent enzyme [Pirellulales bacterium]|nr:aminotransferase class I/II-fold pyridoxal phosphate-dependent enzyme [Pirellulales bacterium]
MAITYSEFARGVRVETAFNVLAVAKRLKAEGKEIIELEIGDSPFPSTASAKEAGLAAIRDDLSHYCPSIGMPELRDAAAKYVKSEHGISATAANIVVGPGAKVFELLFCEAFLNPGDGVLVFSPYFPTYLPNIARRGARAWLADLKQANDFRPALADVERFLADDPRPKAIFVNSPHNPTGGVAAEEDLAGLADLIRGRDIAVFSDEPYDQMVWRGRHHSLLAQPGMLDQAVAAYTFSKSYSMSGWRVGFAVAGPATTELFGTLLNTSLSCVAPLAQLAAAAALEHDREERDRTMQLFHRKVELMAAGLNRIEGVRCLDPGATFYLFPNVAAICNRLRITSHGLAMYLLEAADDRLGVACLGGESFGEAGGGFLRFSCAEPDDRLEQALAFLPRAFSREDRAAQFLADRPQFRLQRSYAV